MNITDSTAQHTTNTETAAPVKKGGTFRAALIVFAAFTIICGIVYPAAVTLVSQTLFPYEANGSFITVYAKDGSQRVYGSEIIGQQFSAPIHLMGRINPGSPSNLSPASAEYKKRIEQRRDSFAADGFFFDGDIPAELVTVSGSGLDPHISPAAAEYQAASIARARNAAGWKLADNGSGKLTPVAQDGADGSTSDFTEAYVHSLIRKYTEGRFLGIFGEPRVNVLLVNLALDGIL